MKILWTDGSAEPNPGAGGFAVIEQLEQPNSNDTQTATETPTIEVAPGVTGRPVVLGGEPHTTNIRMEGSALIAAMEYAGTEGCEIHTDSEFWINVLTKWAPTWQQNGWIKKSGEIKNLDLVKEAYRLYTTHPVELVWTRGHVGTALNELADQWAGKAREGARL